MNPKNLLPNASFELSLGQGLANNWGDLQNPLTLSLSLAGQLPTTEPQLAVVAQAPDGRQAVQVTLEGGVPVYLTSPAVAVEPGRVYVASVYARSDTPSAKLCLALWTRPIDRTLPPDDAPSDFMLLTGAWKRYGLTVTIGMHAKRAVVELQVIADAPGEVCFDAAQLEAATKATAFEARFPVEAALSAQDKPFHGGLHLLDEPLTIDLDFYNTTDRPCNDPLELAIFDMQDRLVATQPVDVAIAPGHTHHQITVDLDRVGEFRANCRRTDGAVIDVGDYFFTVHPVIGEQEQKILYSVDGKIHELAAERMTLPWTNRRDWYAEPAQQLTVCDDGSIYVFAVDGVILRSTDGGRTWQSYEAGPGICNTAASPDEVEDDGLLRGAMSAVSVMPDGTFFSNVSDAEHDRMWIIRSEDRGLSWQPVSHIDTPGGGEQRGQVTRLADGTLAVLVAYALGEQFPCLIQAWLSHDGGKSWTAYPAAPGGEPFLCQRQSGSLLAVLRHSVPHGSQHLDLFADGNNHRRLWQRASGNPKLATYRKNLVMIDSDDDGRTWHGAREVTHGFDEMHGMLLELPDERIALIYVHRMPYTHGGERARISRDGGHTWSSELYYLNTSPAYPGYSANCVLPEHLADGKPGMILSIIGQRAMTGHEAKMFAVRWHPLGV